MKLKTLYRKSVLFRVNHLYAGWNNYEHKRKLLNRAGFDIGEGTKVVGPFYCSAKLKVGRNCWIGKNFMGNGNGSIAIGDCCDIGPEVIFQTGTHEIGDEHRRAGKGIICSQNVGNGVWIGGRSTFIGDVEIADSSIIAGCSCVVCDVSDNVLVGGVPAKVIRKLKA